MRGGEGLILPERVMTCPSTDVAVRERLLPVSVPVRPTVLGRSKHFEPSMWTAPLTELPDGRMLPPIVRGGPETVEVIVNCQLPSTFGPDDGGGELAPPDPPVAPPVAPLVAAWYPPPPHPQRRTSADSPNLFAQRFMDVSPP